MANFEIGKDRNSTPTYIVASAAISKEATNLAASVEQTITVPAGANMVLIQYEPGANVFVAESASPLSLPAGSFAAYTGDLNVPGLYVTAGQTLRFLSDTTAYVVVKFYATNPANG